MRGMATRAVSSKVVRRATNPMVVGESTTKRVDAPPANLAELELKLQKLRACMLHHVSRLSHAR